MLSDLLKDTGPTDFLHLSDRYQEQRYDAVAATEEARRLALAKLQADETAAKAHFDSAAGKRRVWWATLTAEAQRALDVHRRVVESLTQLQAPLP